EQSGHVEIVIADSFDVQQELRMNCDGYRAEQSESPIRGQARDKRVCEHHREHVEDGLPEENAVEACYADGAGQEERVPGWPIVRKRSVIRDQSLRDIQIDGQ